MTCNLFSLYGLCTPFEVKYALCELIQLGYSFHMTRYISSSLCMFVCYLLSLEESLSITTGRCDLAIATHARKMHKKPSI